MKNNHGAWALSVDKREVGRGYEPPEPGHYQLTVRKRFAGDGDWAQSNSVTFDVQAQKPAAISHN